MKAKTTEREEAISLRKLGYSLNEISHKLGIAKSSASLWLRSVTLSEKAKERIATKRSRAREQSAQTKRRKVEQLFLDARIFGDNIVQNANLNQDALRVLCAIMYWCEGTKIRRSEIFGFTNSDPKLMQSFMHLLRSGFQLDEKKLRLTVHVHEYHNASAQLQFWSKLTNIPIAQCHKPYLKPHTALRKREGYQGCANVRYLDVNFGRRLEGIALAFLDGSVV